MIGQLLVILGIFLHWALNILTWVIIIGAVLSWFPGSWNNPVARLILKITSPILEPIRRILPQMPLDISPLIAIALLWLVDAYLAKSLVTIGHRLSMGY
jgi:YggT family protein